MISRSNSVPRSQSKRTNGLISFRLEGSPNASRATRCGHCTRSYRADAVTFMAPFSERVLDAGRC
jgi:hypothetical protein